MENTKELKKKKCLLVFLLAMKYILKVNLVQLEELELKKFINLLFPIFD